MSRHVIFDEGGFRAECVRLSKAEWEDVLRRFIDSCFYQTWAWGAVRLGEQKLNQVLVSKDRNLVAAAQVWIMTAPGGLGIAYVKRGPMWELKSGESDIESFRMAIRAIKSEFIEKRGLMVRVMPNEINGMGPKMRNVLIEEGFGASSSIIPYRTLLLDMSLSMEDIRKGLRRTWRYDLGKAEKNNLTISYGTDEKTFTTVLGLYHRMHERKNFSEFMNIDDVHAAQELLPDDQKAIAMVCEREGKPISGVITSVAGGVAVDLFSATVEEGRRTCSSYLTYWNMIGLVKSLGCRWYDLGGIDPVNCPGTYEFKHGIARSEGSDVSFGEYDLCRSPVNRMAIKAADFIRGKYRNIKRSQGERNGNTQRV